jgi:hypothetical protein
MNEPQAEWIGRFFDGELQGARRAQAEAHLAECEACRAELEQLRTLSGMLQDAPGLDGLVSPSGFVAGVVARLDGRKGARLWRQALPAAWRLAPVAAAGAWAFLQALAVVASLALVAVRAGIGGEALASLLPASGQPWLTVPSDLLGAGLGGLGPALASLAGVVFDLGWSLALAVAPLLGVAALFGAWLAVWWVSGRMEANRPMAAGRGG